MLKFWRYSDSKSSFSDEICYLGPDKNNVCLDTESWRCEALVFFFCCGGGWWRHFAQYVLKYTSSDNLMWIINIIFHYYSFQSPSRDVIYLIYPKFEHFLSCFCTHFLIPPSTTPFLPLWNTLHLHRYIRILLQTSNIHKTQQNTPNEGENGQISWVHLLHNLPTWHFILHFASNIVSSPPYLQLYH